MAQLSTGTPQGRCRGFVDASNAWKFTSKEATATVEVGSEVVDGETRTFVRDNGVGFDMLYGHKLVGAFQRLHGQSEFPGAA